MSRALLQAAKKGQLKKVQQLLAAGAPPGCEDSGGTPALLLAIESGKVRTVQALLDAGANPNRGRTKGMVPRTPLEQAASGGVASIVELLLERGADPSRGVPLLRAASGGDSALLERLLGLGLSIEQTDDLGRTPLLAACSSKPDNALYLLDHGADPLRRDHSGLGALTRAASGGHEELVRRLLELGLSAVEAETTRSPLATAASYDHLGTVRLLLAAGADPGDVLGRKSKTETWPENLIQRASNPIFHALVEAGLPATAVWQLASQWRRPTLASWCEQFPVAIDAVDDRGRTLLHGVALRESALRWLLAQGADPNVADAEGLLPVHLAAMGGTAPAGGPRDAGPLLVLLDGGAVVDRADPDGRTPLHHAVRAGMWVAVERLLALGAPVGALDRQGRTPLHGVGEMLFVDARHRNAIHPDGLTITKALLAAGADASVRDHEGKTAADVAQEHGRLHLVEALTGPLSLESLGLAPTGAAVLAEALRPQVLRLLLAAGADANAIDERGEPVLVYVAAENTDSLRLLLAHGADANAADRHGNTALGRVAWRGDVDEVELLLGAGADPDRPSQGRPPLHIAANAINLRVFGRLLDVADPTRLDGRGRTVVHAAADHPDHQQSQVLRILERLQRAGVDLDAVDGDGRRAYELAEARGMPRVAQWLRARARPA